MVSPRHLIHFPVMGILLWRAHFNWEGVIPQSPDVVVSVAAAYLKGQFAPYVVAFAGTIAVLFLLLPNAERLDFMDHPDGNRKIHTVSKPVIGGLGMFVGIAGALLMFGSGLPHIAGLLSAMLLMTVTGAVDDRHHLSFKIRFALQVLATCAVLVNGGQALHSFGDLFGVGPIETGMIAWPVTIFCVTGVINAINMIDGLDGLAGSVSLMVFIALGAIASIAGRPDLVLLSVVFSGALVAFLYFNWNPARLFMGDAGSMAIGFALAYLSIEVTQGIGVHAVPPVAALFALAIPVSDTLVVMVKRMIGRKHPFHPDKNHIHHLLQRMGFGHRGSVLIIIGLTSMASSVAIIGTMLHVSETVLFDLWAGCFWLYVVASYNVRPIYRMVYRFRMQKNRLLIQAKPVVQ